MVTPARSDLHDVTLVGDPAWRLVEEQGVLVATGGGDQVWVVDDLPGSVAAELAGCWSDNPPRYEDLSAQALRAVEQLRSLGAIIPGGLSAGPTMTVGIVWCGEDVDAMADPLASLLGPRWTSAADADLVVVVRSTLPLADVPAAISDVAHRPHLFVDLASHRTIALGPFVVPGYSACLGCMTGRVRRRWGDPPPPSIPGATAPAIALMAAGWTAAQLDAIATGRYELLDRTHSLNVLTGEATTAPVLRWADCPQCARAVTTGRVSLPWA